MKTLKQSRSLAFVLSILLHCLLLSFLFINFKSEPALKLAASSPSPQDIVQATIIDEKLVAAEVARLDGLEEARQKDETKKRQAENDKIEQVKREREQEQAKVLQLKKELEKTREKEEAKLAELRLQQEKEKQKLATLKQDQEQERVKIQNKEPKEKKILETKKTPEENIAEKSPKVAAAPKKIDSQKKSNIPIKNQAAEKSSDKDHQTAQIGQAESALQNALHQEWITSELAKYQGLIQKKVNQAWLRAPGLPTDLLCLLEIRLLPNGSVVELKIASSSGNVAFDQAAEAAIRKASPLPVPSEPELMDKFKHFTFEFKPPAGA